jgi:hypothetical protein
MVAVNTSQGLPPVLRYLFRGDAYYTLFVPVPDRERDRMVASVVCLVFIERKKEFLGKLDAYPVPAYRTRKDLILLDVFIQTFENVSLSTRELDAVSCDTSPLFPYSAIGDFTPLWTFPCKSPHRAVLFARFPASIPEFFLLPQRGSGSLSYWG